MSLAEPQPFNQRTLLALIGLGAAAFLAMAFFMISGEGGRGLRVASPTTNSRSAIGYRAFTELLRRFELAIVAPTPAQIAGASLRIVLAPKTPEEVRGGISSTPGPVLIVLPKWQAYAQTLGDSVASVRLLGPETVSLMAREIADDIEIGRPASVGAWRNEGIEGEPQLRQPQLVRSAKLCPLVSTAEGMLLARLCRRPNVVVLADPDVLANHGLWRGDNAVLAMSAVAFLRTGSGPIVALEAVAELPPSRSIWRLAFSPPFATITLAALIATVIAGWAAALRFGPPASDEPARPPGIMPLIDIAARLLRDKVDGARLLRRYAELATLDLGRRLHAPRRLQGAAEIGAWLDASKRGGSKDGLRYADLARDVEAAARNDKIGPDAAVATAARLHRWREELLNGR